MADEYLKYLFLQEEYKKRQDAEEVEEIKKILRDILNKKETKEDEGMP